MGTPREAVQDADAVLLTVRWSRIDDVLSQAGDLSGKVIISCSLPINANDSGLVIGHTTSGAEALAEKAPQARVASAFSTAPSEVFFGVYAARLDAKSTDPASCSVEKIYEATRSQLSSFAPWVSILLMPGPCELPGTWSPSRY
jgi:8-hydroxy-5-deazaflavin:NADPH oxidoreductase